MGLLIAEGLARTRGTQHSSIGVGKGGSSLFKALRRSVMFQILASLTAYCMWLGKSLTSAPAVDPSFLVCKHGVITST